MILIEFILAMALGYGLGVLFVWVMDTHEGWPTNIRKVIKEAPQTVKDFFKDWASIYK